MLVILLFRDFEKIARETKKKAKELAPVTQERKEGWGRTESQETESNVHATQSLLRKEEKASGIKEVSSSLGWEGSTQNSGRWWVVLGAKETKQGSG